MRLYTSQKITEKSDKFVQIKTLNYTLIFYSKIMVLFSVIKTLSSASNFSPFVRRCFSNSFPSRFCLSVIEYGLLLEFPVQLSGPSSSFLVTICVRTPIILTLSYACLYGFAPINAGKKE